MPPADSEFKVRNVAIIGAGASGLSAAKELRREGHKVVVFERQGGAGGAWVYNPTIEADGLGSDTSRTVVHSSVYAGLRTNLPRELMGFREYPFVSTCQAHRDSRRFPGHREVLLYLNDYASAFGLTELIRFETEVVYAGWVSGKWRVRSRTTAGETIDETFDAVVVCNGHYTEPRIADIPGIDAWPGKQIHSHNYRSRDPFRDLVVIMIGSGSSAFDISMEIAEVGKEVHIVSRSAKVGVWETQLSSHNNLKLHFTTKIESVHKDGSVILNNGSVLLPDVILHCTGYKYNFPFLDTNDIVTVEDNCVGPLYKHTFPPALGPCLSFIGLPWMGIGFINYEFQSKWIAGALSGRIGLPSEEEMMKDIEAFYLSLEASGTPKRYTHNVADYRMEYLDWLAGECGIPGVEEWRKAMYYATKKNYVANGQRFRDEWEDDHLVLEAQEDFTRWSSNGVFMAPASLN